MQPDQTLSTRNYKISERASEREIFVRTQQTRGVIVVVVVFDIGVEYEMLFVRTVSLKYHIIVFSFVCLFVSYSYFLSCITFAFSCVFCFMISVFVGIYLLWQDV